MAGFVQKLKDMWASPEDEYDYYDDYDIEDISSVDTKSSKKKEVAKAPVDQTSKILNIHATAQLQVVLFKPASFGEETRTVADELLKMHTVVLNLESVDKEVCRRILDFISGVAYANGGKIKRVATGTFIITPYNVDLTGDELIDELESNGMYF